MWERLRLLQGSGQHANDNQRDSNRRKNSQGIAQGPAQSGPFSVGPGCTSHKKIPHLNKNHDLMVVSIS